MHDECIGALGEVLIVRQEGLNFAEDWIGPVEGLRHGGGAAGESGGGFVLAEALLGLAEEEERGTTGVGIGEGRAKEFRGGGWIVRGEFDASEFEAGGGMIGVEGE